MENYEDIFYRDCPHFTIGRVDQWSENGYLYHDGKVYAYEEDRKEQTGRTHSPMTADEFLAYAEQQQMIVPEEFLTEIKSGDNE